MKRIMLLLGLGAVIGGMLAACGSPQPAPVATVASVPVGTPTSAPVSLAPTATALPPTPAIADPYATDPSIGPVGAPVTVIEYGNFECTLCRQWFESEVHTGLVGEFAGQVRYVWRDYPIASVQSPIAAEGGHCAHAQGKFFEFAAVAVKLRSELNADTLNAIAARLGLDTVQFGDCLGTGQFASKVKTNWDEAKQLGQSFAPVWTVNGKVVENAGPQTLVAAINEILNSR